MQIWSSGIQPPLRSRRWVKAGRLPWRGVCGVKPGSPAELSNGDRRRDRNGSSRRFRAHPAETSRLGCARSFRMEVSSGHLD